MAELLIELFSEEIPSRMQARALDDFLNLFSNKMVERGLTYGEKSGFVTPRRLVLMMDDVPAHSMPSVEERKGPRVDAPEKAIEGFLRSTGLEKSALEIREDKKGATYFAVIRKDGEPAETIIADVLREVIETFPWPKSMRWGRGELKWVRPLQSILAILSENDEARVIDFEINGLRAGNVTYGHRFMAPDAIKVNSIGDYIEALGRAYVVLDSGARRDKIEGDASTLAFAKGLTLLEDEALLRENAGLVEFPVIYLGDIDEDFLDLPPEVLQTSMAEHQKFLSLANDAGKITGYVIVANRETADDGATIRAGNAKVLRARLSDAKFFWENDCRLVSREGATPWLQTLSNVTFHNKLGTQGARIDRISLLAAEVANYVGANTEDAARAARLAKLDLASEMVYEFPELQGVMGQYYLEKMGEPREIADVAAAHYSPLGPSDDVPSAPLSVAVALADKLDLLTGFWAIGETPTGSKDPFALRRAALGVIRLVLENEIDMPLIEVIELANDKTDAVELLRFFHDRLKVYLRDKDIRHDVIDAVLATGRGDDLLAVSKRAHSLQAMLNAEGGNDLQAGLKRALNILRAEEEKDGVSYELDPEAGLLKDPAEKALGDALAAAKPAMEAALKADDYDAAMREIAALRGAIDRFFVDVVVNSDNAVVRRNRLCLLNQIRVLAAPLADFSKLEG